MFSFFRVVKFAFQDFFRNFSLSFMTIVMLILMLLSVNVFIVVRVLTDKAVAAVKDQIDVSIYFRPDISDQQIGEVRNHLKTFPEVTTTTFLSQKEVLEKFKETHKGNKEILSSLDEIGENPLGATLIVKTRDPSDYKKIITAINVPEYEKIIEDKTFATTENTIENIHVITTNVQKFVLVIGILFTFISLLVIFNTIRVGIYTHRMEIAVKKLVGATNWFIQGPYFVQSFIFSLVSVTLTLLLIFVSTRFIDPYISVVFHQNQFLTNYFFSHILVLFGAQLGIVFFLTLCTSGLAMRKYLRI